VTHGGLVGSSDVSNSLEVNVSRSYRAGLIVLGVLSVLDLFGPLLTDGEHPPMAVAVVGAVIGLVSIGLVVAAWRGTSRAVIPLVVLRLLSALSAVPAFFVDDVPAAALGAAAAIVALSVVGVIVVLSGLRQPSVAAAR
jgi:hypothetical protein